VSRRIPSLLLVFVGASLSHLADADQHGPIQAAGSEWAKHYQAGDLDSLMTLYADDVIVALHGQPALYGKQAVRDYFSTRIGTSEVTFELDYEVEKVEGDIAWIISKYWLHSVNRETGFVYKDAGRSMLVYRKESGRWLIVADLDQATPDVGWPSPGGLE